MQELKWQFNIYKCTFSRQWLMTTQGFGGSTVNFQSHLLSRLVHNPEINSQKVWFMLKLANRYKITVNKCRMTALACLNKHSWWKCGRATVHSATFFWWDFGNGGRASAGIFVRIWSCGGGSTLWAQGAEQAAFSVSQATGPIQGGSGPQVSAVKRLWFNELIQATKGLIWFLKYKHYREIY